MPKTKEKVAPAKTYSIYDPSVNAFREVSKEVAEKFVASAKKVEQKLAEDNDNE